MSKDLPKKEVEKLIKKLGSQLFNIENYYLVYSELGLHSNSAVNSQSSKVYVEVMDSNKGFFIPVQNALRHALTVELHSFIVSKDWESFKNAIEHLKKLEDGLNLLPDYSLLKKNNKKILNHIEGLRNQYFAHKSGQDLSKLPNSSDKEFQNLFFDIKKILNKASNYFGNQFWYMEGDSRESIKDTHDMMNNLLRGESRRLSEINVEYISDIYRIGKRKWMEE
jgi:hypothetical protein